MIPRALATQSRKILTVAFGEHALALENASPRLDSPATVVREEKDAFTVSTICDFIEPMLYERVEATDYSVSFGVTSRVDSYLYRPTSLWHFSGQCGSTSTAMLNKHVFFLVQMLLGLSSQVCGQLKEFMGEAVGRTVCTKDLL
ncbi:uncharacterized protein LOC144165239 [Haemaphysalis longicornis]